MEQMVFLVAVETRQGLFKKRISPICVVNGMTREEAMTKLNEVQAELGCGGKRQFMLFEIPLANKFEP